MGGCCTMSDANDEKEVKNKTCHKRWEHNLPGVAEEMVLLELVEVLERRGKHTEEGKITISVDNRKTCNKVVTVIRKTSEHVQNANAEIAQKRK